MKTLKTVSCVMVILLGAMLPPVLAAPAPDKAGTPSNTVKTFFTSMANTDFAAAKKCVKADELKQMITALEKLIKEVPDLKKDTAEEYAPMVKAQYLAEKITGSKAEVTISYKTSKGVKKETYKLEKSGSQWVIAD